MRSSGKRPGKICHHILSSICILFILVTPETILALNSAQKVISANSRSQSNDSINTWSSEKTVSPVDSLATKSRYTYGLKQFITDSSLKAKKSHKQINQAVLWVLGYENIAEYKHQMSDFGNNNIPLFLRVYYMQILERTYTYPVILLFTIFILLLLLNLVVVLLVVYFSNKIKSHKERYLRIYRNSYEEILRSYLFGEIKWDFAQQKLKKSYKKQNRKILTDVLLTFKENLRGEMDLQIQQLYLKFKLEKDSLKLSKSIHYYMRIQGLKALTNLDPENAKKIIPIFLNDSHLLVRTEAQIAYVRLYPEKPFEFLKTLTSPFPRWTQLSSFHILRLHQVPVPAFGDYLDSDVPSVKNFSLRMIIFFQQLENAATIYQLLESPVEATRLLAIRAINDLRLYEGRPMIKSIYQSESEKNRIEIVKAIKNIGDQDDIDFLESVIQSGSVSLKIEACRSLLYVNKEELERLSLLNQDNDLEIDQLLAHVNDPRN
jgi:predicted Holliday junction resolvase-like endonuclease